MRKLSSLLFVGALSILSVHAQEEGSKHEFRIGYSDALPISLADDFGSLFSEALIAPLDGRMIKSNESKSAGMFHLGYRIQINDRISIGGDVTFMHIKRTIEFIRQNSTQIEKEEKNSNLFGILPTLEVAYLKRSVVTLYGSAAGGIGITATKDGGQTSDFAFQVNPIGIKVGKRVGGFAEVGFGYKGIVSLGAYFKI